MTKHYLTQVDLHDGITRCVWYIPTDKAEVGNKVKRFKDDREWTVHEVYRTSAKAIDDKSGRMSR